MTTEIGIDALLPAEMAKRAEYVGVRKAETPFITVMALSILAGAFIALGAIFATTILSGGMTLRDAEGAIAFTTGIRHWKLSWHGQFRCCGTQRSHPVYRKRFLLSTLGAQ